MSTLTPSRPAFDPPDSEIKPSLWLLASVLGVLWLAKAAAPLPYVGPVALTGAAFWQLRAPLWRVERAGLSLEALGCHLGAWRMDVKTTLGLAFAVLPLYALGYHLLMTHGASAAHALWPDLARRLPMAHPIWHMPRDAWAWAQGSLWFGERALTHTFGVALPEELFYRGYLQPLWQAYWPAKRSIFGAWIGWATIGACAAFALGHWLGEWQIGRFGPFFPSLLFAWQRSRSDTIVGAVGLHALCNLFAEVWVRQYAPGA